MSIKRSTTRIFRVRIRKMLLRRKRAIHNYASTILSPSKEKREYWTHVWYCMECMCVCVCLVERSKFQSKEIMSIMRERYRIFVICKWKNMRKTQWKGSTNHIFLVGIEIESRSHGIISSHIRILDETHTKIYSAHSEWQWVTGRRTGKQQSHRKTPQK